MNRVYKMKLNKQSGSILIEALIAVIVLGIGIVAIAKLQGSFIKEGSNSQSRNVALQLAQRKIDDLRTFNAVGGTSFPSSVWPTTITNYSQIQDDLGGVIAYTTTATVVGNTEYNMFWDVINYQLPNASSAPVVLADGNISDSSYKAVTVTVGWTNMEGGTEQVELTSYIANIDAYGEKLLNAGSAGGVGPKVVYNPGAAPDVIAIDTSGESVETTLPEPAIKTIAGEDYFYSQFETVTYDGAGIALQEEEFLNIRCSCEYDNSAFVGSAFPVARSIWHPDPETDTEEHLHFVASFFHPNDHDFIAQNESKRADMLGPTITKVIGQSDLGASAQHPFCNICCRDHHDGNYSYLSTVDLDVDSNPDNSAEDATSFACEPNDDTPAGGQRSNCVDPWRPAVDYSTTYGDHKHYDVSGNEIAPGATGTYLEACRLKRINGKFNVFQDWHLHGSTYAAAARDAFTPGAPNSVTTQYRAYIKSYITQAITNQNNLPVTSIVNPATSFIWPPTNTSSYPITTRFIARGIYMDYMDSYTLGILDDIRVNQPTTFFENVPFNEINLTRLTDWQPECVNSSSPNLGDVADNNTGFILVNGSPVSSGCVTNFDIEKTPNGLPSEINRGLVKVLSATDSFTLQANMLLSNTGIVGNNDFLPESNITSTYPTVSDLSYDLAEVHHSITIGTPPTGVTFNVDVTRPNGWTDNKSEVAVSINNVGASEGCTKQSSDTDWECSTSSSSWTGVISVTGDGSANFSGQSCSGSSGTLTKTTGSATDETITCTLAP